MDAPVHSGCIHFPYAIDDVQKEYLRQSILEPERYIVSDYRDIMYPDYSTPLTKQNIQDLIAYLLTL